jgi:hypothetical protein
MKSKSNKTKKTGAPKLFRGQKILESFPAPAGLADLQHGSFNRIMDMLGYKGFRFPEGFADTEQEVDAIMIELYSFILSLPFDEAMLIREILRNLTNLKHDTLLLMEKRGKIPENDSLQSFLSTFYVLEEEKEQVQAERKKGKWEMLMKLLGFPKKP